MNFMNQDFKPINERIRLIDVDKQFEIPEIQPPSRVQTLLSQQQSSQESQIPLWQQLKNVKTKIQQLRPKKRKPAPQDEEAGKVETNCEVAMQDLEEISYSTTNLEKQFSFSDIQEIHELEDFANEALRALQNNIDVLVTIKDRYELLWNGECLSSEMKETCKHAFTKFQYRVADISDELRLHQANILKFSQILTERKNAVSALKQSMSRKAESTLGDRYIRIPKHQRGQKTSKTS